MKKNNWLFLAVAAHGKGISGGDRIFIEFARRWSRLVNIKLVLWEEGFEMCQRQNLQSVKNRTFEILPLEKWNWLGFNISYLVRIIYAVLWSVKTDVNQYQMVYTASEFWMDVFPAVILKLKNQNIKWTASWYQTAPNPFIGYSTDPGVKRYRFKALIYWLIQQPSKWMIANYADFILVNNEQEKRIFPRHLKRKRISVVFGAVDKQKIDSYKIPKQPKKQYDAVFQGRFHPQKGVEELIDIWKLVCKKRPGAMLCMIGDGPLIEKVKLKIAENKLNKNIVLKGFVFDGKDKYQIFSESKLVVHPSLFDSGGMASSEAMIFGIPVIGYDLPSFQTYYPKGMVTVPVGNKKLFSKICLDLLNDSYKRKRIGQEGKKFIIKNRLWDHVCQEIFSKISLISE